MADGSDRYCALKFDDFTLNDERNFSTRFARTFAVLPANAVRVLRTCGSSIAPVHADFELCATKLLSAEAQRAALTDLRVCRARSNAWPRSRPRQPPRLQEG